MATYPIENKNDLIAALKELSDSELGEANLQKKGSIDTSTPEGKAAADLRQQQLIKELELQKKIAIAVGDVQEAYNTNLELGKQRIDQLLQEGEAGLRRGLEDEKLSKILGGMGDIQQEYIKGEISLAELKERINQKLKIANNEGKKYKRTFESIATHLGMSTKGVAGMLKSAVSYNMELNEKMEDGKTLTKDAIEKQKQFALAFKSTFNFANLAAAALTAYIETTLKNIALLDSALASFAASTGAGRQYAGVIETARANNVKFNVSAAESAKATQALFEGFIGFTTAGDAAQTSLTEFTSQIGKFGVDGATAVDILNFFNTNLGKTTEESAALTKELAMMGPRIGISTSKITKDFQAALPTLAVYGDRAVDVFQGLAGAARMAGMETSKLLDLANKFDTFSSSAETAGKLNAILGTQISAMEMLNMKENERIETLIRSVQATGIAFKDLGRFEQKAIAAAAGISDLNEAQKIFGMNLADFQRQQATLDQSAKVQEEFNQALKDMIPIKEKFMALFARFAPTVSEFLTGAHTVLDFIGETLDNLDPETLRGIGMFAASLASIVVAIKAAAAVKGVLAALGSGLGLIGTVGPAAGAGGAAAGKGLAALLTPLATPQVALVIGGLTIALMGLMGAYSLMTEAEAKREDAKARQIEGNVALAESFSEIGGSLQSISTATFEAPIAGLQAMAQALSKFQNVDVNARATLTNLALLSAGKAADSASNARIVSAAAANINNVNNNSFAPNIVVEINGEQFDATIKRNVVETVTSPG